MILEKTKDYFMDLDSKFTLIPLSYDKLFKSVFKLNLDLLRKFLNEMIPIEITEEDKIILLDTELPISNKKERKKMIDIFVTINENIFIDIEMNRSKFRDIYERNRQYLEKISNLLFEKGENIKNLKDKNLYQLNINANKQEKVTNDMIVSYGIITKDIYPSARMIVKGLERYREMYYSGDRRKEVIWLTVLAARTFTELYELVSQLLKTDEVKRFMEVVEDMCKDEFVLHEWQQDKMEELVKHKEIENATNEGKAIGIDEGKAEGKIEVAKNLLKKNMNLEDISEVTGLSLKQINEIKESYN